MRVIFGVDIGGTEIKTGVFSHDCKLLEKWTVKTDLSERGRHIIPSVAKNISDYIKQNRIDVENVTGIGLGIPGPVSKKGHVEKCVNLHWENFNPVKELSIYFPNCLIKAGNDANVAALGEYVKGAGKDASSMMLITLGTGVGGGIILNGKLLPGSHGLAGEIGHVAVGDEPEKCNCGNQGCIDQSASATGIVRKAKRFLENSEEPSRLREFEELTAKDVCDCARECDPLAQKILEKCMYPLGKGMACFSLAFDPEVYVISGGVSAAGEILLDPIRKSYEENMYLTNEGADIRLAKLGNDAGITGAAVLVSER